MDSAGGADRKGIVMHYWPELDAFFERVRSQLHEDLPYGNRLAAFSDYLPFFEAGVPNAGMGDVEATYSGRGFGHTAFDTLNKLHLSDLRASASLASCVLLRIAGAEKWPARRRRIESRQSGSGRRGRASVPPPQNIDRYCAGSAARGLHGDTISYVRRSFHQDDVLTRLVALRSRIRNTPGAAVPLSQ